MAVGATAAFRTRTDEQIQKDVLDEIKWDARVQPNEIGVAVKDGVVTLTGSVDSDTKKWAAEEAALMRAAGMNMVQMLSYSWAARWSGWPGSPIIRARSRSTLALFKVEPY